MFKYRFIAKLFLIVSALLASTNAFANCSIEQVRNVRASALKSYKNNELTSAEKVLSNYYNQKCSFYQMSKADDSTLNAGLWLISDLMLYRKINNDYLGCLALGDDIYQSWMLSDPNRHTAQVEKALQTEISACRNELNNRFPEPVACTVEGHEDLFAIPSSWGKENELFYEIACAGFITNSPNLMILNQRDGPKLQSEGMNSVARLDVLYVHKVKQRSEENSNDETRRIDYQLDPVYFVSENGSLWGGDGDCYLLNLKFGNKAGIILLDGDSTPCGGGSAQNINRLIANLEFPFKAQIIHETFHSIK